MEERTIAGTGIRESEAGHVAPSEVAGAVKLRLGVGKLALGLGARGLAGRMLGHAAGASPRYKPAAVALIRHGFAGGNDYRAMLAAARFYAAALDPAPLRNACDRLFKAGARMRDLNAMFREVTTEVRIANPMRERVKRAAAPADGEAWDRRVDFGALAAQMTFAWGRLRPSRKQMDKVFAQTDWSPVEECLAAGRPAILASAHIGPELMTPYAEMHAGYPLAVVSAIWQLPKMPHAVLVPIQKHRGTALARVARLLRKGHALSMAIDERFGGDHAMEPFFGTPVTLARGAPMLARLTGAATFLPVVNWTSDFEIGARVIEIDVPELDDEEAWTAAWNHRFMQRLERLLIEEPEILRLFSGVWRRANWTEEETALHRRWVGD